MKKINDVKNEKNKYVLWIKNVKLKRKIKYDMYFVIVKNRIA